MTMSRPFSRFRTGRAVAIAMGIVFAPAALTGCMGEKDVDLTTLVIEDEPADQLYNQGLANLESGRLKEAAAKFAAVDRQHPYSEFARKSLVMGAFAQYRMGQYDEAIIGAKRYLTLYSANEDAAYAQYIIGLSWFRQIRDVTTDQLEARRTIEAMDELIQRWPDSEYVEDGKAKIRFARDQLAGKEMQIGRYYLERREYGAAIKRFRVVVEHYSNTRQVEEALARLVEAYYSLGIAGEAQTAAAVLGRNFPDSEWYASSYKLLQTGGMKPRENAGSWISRAAASLGGA